MIGYHLTSSRYRDSIAENGILPGGDGGFEKTYVWCFVDFEIAEAAAAEGAFEFGRRRPDVWIVDLDGLEVAPDPHPGWGRCRPGWDAAARVIVGPVPPTAIRLGETMRVPG